MLLDVRETTGLLNKSVGKIPVRVTPYVLIWVLYVSDSIPLSSAMPCLVNIIGISKIPIINNIFSFKR